MTARISAVTMPKWGMTMTEGKVARWRAAEGEDLVGGADLVEIETSKIANVVTFDGAGVLRKILVGQGATAPVGAVLAIIAAPDVSDAEITVFLANRADTSGNDAPELDVASSARLIAAGAHQLNVRTTGEGVLTPIIFIHGFGGDLNSWLFNQPELSGARVAHALDLPGHGQSSATYGKGSARGLSEAVFALMDSLALPRAHMVGHSLGGAIALLMAAGKPERVASVTGVAPGGLGPELNRTFIDGFIAANARKPMQEALGLLFARPETVTRAMVEEALHFKRQDGAVEALTAIAAANFTPDGQKSGLRDLLPGIKAPVQIIWGRQDKIIPMRQAEGLPSNVATTLLDDAGHMPHMERAADVNRLIAAFVARHD